MPWRCSRAMGFALSGAGEIQSAIGAIIRVQPGDLCNRRPFVAQDKHHFQFSSWQAELLRIQLADGRSNQCPTAVAFDRHRLCEAGDKTQRMQSACAALYGKQLSAAFYSIKIKFFCQGATLNQNSRFSTAQKRRSAREITAASAIAWAFRPSSRPGRSLTCSPFSERINASR